MHSPSETTMTLDEFFGHLWKDYTAIAPAAFKLYNHVLERESRIVNDHVAFRTYNLAPMNLDALEPHVLALGYQRYAPYEFKDKKLRAYGYVHPREDAPRVFLSELETEKLSPFVQETVRGLVAQVDPESVKRPEFLWSGRPWKPVTKAVYEKLAEESEYAAWMALHGLHANHFTISVNFLESMETIQELLDFVESRGFALNTAGGRVKGSPEVLLEQGSTMADEVEYEFSCGCKAMVPTCYYEFARRYPDPATGKIYDGFVAASADKIFESTNRRA